MVIAGIQLWHRLADFMKKMPIYYVILSEQERIPLLKRLNTLQDLDSNDPSDSIKPALDTDLQSELLNITGLDTFCLSYKVLFIVHSFMVSHSQDHVEKNYLMGCSRFSGHYP